MFGKKKLKILNASLTESLGTANNTIHDLKDECDKLKFKLEIISNERDRYFKSLKLISDRLTRI